MPDFQAIFAEMAKNPPNFNDPIPTSNRPETMYGATIPFHVLSWIAVITRLYTRFKVVREPGWDDYFVIAAAIFNLASMVCFLGSINYGMGEHLLAIQPDGLQDTFKWLYVQTGSYITTTALIKLSLLCQYLRIFRSGWLRTATIFLLVIVTLWGAAFSFMAWFPCFPVSGFWDRMQVPAPKCYGFGFGDVDSAYAVFVTVAATNMFFDMVIFLLPMVEYLKPGLRRKQVLAMTGLFTLGSIVVLMAIIRLWTAVKHRADRVESMDFTWWYPLTVILSCLEVDFAIMCASMPIFWPVIVASLTQIFVTKEVHVVHHQRLNDSSQDYEMDRPNSLKSNGSQEGLTRMTAIPKTNYSDQFVLDHVTGKVPGSMEVGVEGKGQGKWKPLGS